MKSQNILRQKYTCEIIHVKWSTWVSVDKSQATDEVWLYKQVKISHEENIYVNNMVKH